MWCVWDKVKRRSPQDTKPDVSLARFSNNYYYYKGLRCTGRMTLMFAPHRVKGVADTMVDRERRLRLGRTVSSADSTNYLHMHVPGRYILTTRFSAMTYYGANQPHTTPPSPREVHTGEEGSAE